ncbi:hypothetical protein [Bacilliculturomica massiliensis]|nr:hypothetical protein [Bacilliculturomica massiliensis]
MKETRSVSALTVAHFARLRPQCKMGQHGSGAGRESEGSAWRKRGAFQR